MPQPRKFWILRRVRAFVVSAATMLLLGSGAQSYFVQEAWSSAAGHADGTAPVAIPLADRIAWAAHDGIGIFRLYGAATSIALFVAFLVAGALARLTGLRVVVFGVAGASALFVLFTTMRSLLGTVGIFGARGPAALSAQMVVGALAGVLFASLTKSPKFSVLR